MKIGKQNLLCFARIHRRMIVFIQISTRAATLHFLITQICLAYNLYTYTSIALFQLITYPDRTNVSMCSM